MQLDGTFGLAEFGPGKNGKTEIDGSYSLGLRLPSERRSPLRSIALTSFTYGKEELFVKLIGLLLIDPG